MTRAVKLLLGTFDLKLIVRSCRIPLADYVSYDSTLCQFIFVCHLVSAKDSKLGIGRFSKKYR